MVIIKRRYELEKIKKLGNWIFICGRRKTGKTFFVKNFMKWDEYFFVKKDRSIFNKEDRQISYETFLELFKKLIKEKTIVIDEFHRLPEDFFDYLHYLGKKGRLIVISSTLWLSKKLLGSGSPLMGLFPLFIFDLVNVKDVINSLKRKVSKKELIEASVYIREPLLAINYKPPIKSYLANFLSNYKLTIKEIIGEIFEEEERKISLVYGGILRAIASGKVTSTEISSYLFSKKIIEKDNPGYIQKYLDILVKIGLLEKFPVLKKKKFVYKHKSSLFDLHYYLDEKYNYLELDLDEKFLVKVIKEKLPLHIEQFFSSLLAEHFGMKRVIIEEPQIDIALVDFKKLKVVAEVKWKKKIKREEIKRIEEKLNSFNVRKILILPDKKLIKEKLKDIEILDVKDILNLIKKNN